MGKSTDNHYTSHRQSKPWHPHLVTAMAHFLTLQLCIIFAYHIGLLMAQVNIFCYIILITNCLLIKIWCSLRFATLMHLFHGFFTK